MPTPIPRKGETSMDAKKGYLDKHSSSSGVMRALDALTPAQHKIFFSIGATLAFVVLLRFVMNDIVRNHTHASTMRAVAEWGGSIALLVVAIAFMVPKFGMWLLTNMPLPKFLSRGSK